MFTQRQTCLEKALLSALAALLLLTGTGRSAALADGLPTTAAPLPSNPSPTMQPGNNSMEEPKVLRSHRSCGSEHDKYCENGGECMFPQDSDKPFCICASSYSGPRCLFINEPARSLPELEQLIGIGFGAAMLVFILAVLFYCFAYKRCVKSAPLIKSAPSETSV